MKETERKEKHIENYIRIIWRWRLSACRPRARSFFATKKRKKKQKNTKNPAQIKGGGLQRVRQGQGAEKRKRKKKPKKQWSIKGGGFQRVGQGQGAAARRKNENKKNTKNSAQIKGGGLQRVGQGQGAAARRFAHHRGRPALRPGARISMGWLVNNI